MSIVPPEEIARDCEPLVEVVEDGFQFRVVIDAGTFLYDPILGWVEDDGTLYISDHGPQKDPFVWDPAQGHGAIHRLTRGGKHSRVIEPGSVLGMPYLIRRAPPWFGRWGGDIFFPSQSKGGRDGALSGHRVYRLREGQPVPETFAEVPRAGKVGGGVPGAMMIGGFGRQGSPHEGLYLCQTMMNCVVYKVTADGDCSPMIILDEPVVPEPVMPYFVFYAGPVWGDLEGQLLLAGLTGSSFEKQAPSDHQLDYYLIEGEELRPEPVRRADIGYAMAEVAPPEFGPYGGHTFLVEFGSTNQMHVTKMPPGPLPYDERILRVDPEGRVHVFAHGLQGGWNELRFDRDRMYISCLRKSYSTGEYREPDGSVYEIRFTG